MEKKSYGILQLADFEKEIREMEVWSGIATSEPLSSGITDDELKERILQLIKKLEAGDAGDWEASIPLDRSLREAVRRLGEKGAIHLEWMRDNHPEGIAIYIDSWAGRNPTAVLDYITSSAGPAPCAPETLMKVLRRLGADQPDDFLATVKKVPWEKFLFTSDPFGRGLHIESQEEVNVWVNSGAARALLEDGVEISGLFWYWTQEDPAASMHGWNEWGDPESDASVGAFHEILKAQLKDPEKASSFNESLSQLDEASLLRMKAAWAALEKKRPWAADEIRKPIPLLQSWSSPATPAEP